MSDNKNAQEFPEAESIDFVEDQTKHPDVKPEEIAKDQQ